MLNIWKRNTHNVIQKSDGPNKENLDNMNNKALAKDNHTNTNIKNLENQS